MEQFCSINAPFQPLANPSSFLQPYMPKWPGNKGTVLFSNISCVIYIHTYCGIIPSNPQTQGSTVTIICPDKATSPVHLQQPFHILRLSPVFSTTSNYFQFLVMSVSIDTANIKAINISTLDSRIWHFSRKWIQAHLQKLTNFPEVPVTQLYRDLISGSEQIHSFTTKDDDDSSLIWTILQQPGTCIGTISMICLFCIGVYCFRFWIRHAAPRHWPYSPVSLQHAIVDADVEVAPIYCYVWQCYVYVSLRVV